tara:strand:+ start:64 stop:984 length:921 start_codon:yes stop_codon:yes gene_type:complete
MYQDVHYLNERVGMPPHFNLMVEPIPENVRQEYFKAMSQEIQQAAKFYIDQKDEHNILSEQEVEKIIPAMPVYAPYKLLFIQIETPDAVMNVLVRELDYTAEETDEPIFLMSMLMYDRENGYFVHDYSQYAFTFHKGEVFIEGLGESGKTLTAEDYTYWVQGHFVDYIITDPDEQGQYTNVSLNIWTKMVSSAFITLNIMLNYPEITQSKDVQGRPNTTDGHTRLKKFTHTVLAERPSYEHKTLKLDMYGNDEAGGGCGNSRSSGTAFHSVRKHIRKLANGKTTFVKAHFRGSKDVGIIDKDYEVK